MCRETRLGKLVQKKSADSCHRIISEILDETRVKQANRKSKLCFNVSAVIIAQEWAAQVQLLCKIFNADLNAFLLITW